MTKNNNGIHTESIGSNAAHLRAVLETVIDGIITISRKGIIQTVNPASMRIFGYKSEEMIGQNVKMLMPAPYAEEHDSYLHNYLTTGDKKIIGIGREVIGKRKDGSTFPMELAVSEMDVNGERMFTGIVRDITERKQAESDIQSREQRIRTLVDTIVDGIIVIDERGRIETFNPAAETLFGYHSDEVKSKNIKMLMPEPYSSAHDGYLHNFLTTGERKIIGIGREVIGKRKDGSVFPMDLAVSEMTVSGKRMFTGIVRDISERKAAEAALAEKNRALEITAAFERTQAQVMTLFSSIYDVDTVFKRVLEILAEEHGFAVSAMYLSDEWHGNLNCVASYGMPENFSRQLTSGSGFIGQSAKEGKPIILTAEEDMPFLIDTGLFSIVPAAVMVSPITYGEKVLGVMALATAQPLGKNVSGFIEHLADQMGNLHQYHDMKALSEQLKQRGSEISQKNAQLEQANRLKTEFLANMSHELRTPLNAIIGFSEVLKDQLLGELNAEQTDYTGEIFDSANHLLSLINDILDLSKIEAGKMELYLETLNVPEMFRNALSVVKEKAHNHGIQLDLKVADDIGAMQADGRKLKQVIFNLLSNAVKFTPDGGRVTIEVVHSDKNLQVTVTDTGIDIAADEIGLLFRPFEQLDGSLSRQYEGTGLGLVMVKRLVELHGGEISVTSTKGKGSSFQFTIPYRTTDEEDSDEVDVRMQEATDTASVSTHPPQAQQSRQSDRASETPLIQPEVLIVEDNDQAAELMSIQLKGAGYKIQRARDGSEALKLAKSLRPDLVIMDILLPDFDGWEVMRRMNQDPELAAIPVVVVSIVADTKKGIELGAVDVLEKPLRKLALLEAIGKAMPLLSDKTAKILVVDDEEKAVQFMLAHLKEAGFDAIGAYGGREAIELSRSEHPDLIILDLMMPEVTGFDVLSALRADAATHDIPVTILTAKILTEEDRQQLQDGVAQIVSKTEFDTKAFMADVQAALPDFIHTGLALRTSQDSKPRVLVVEDNKNQSGLLQLYLEDVGYHVTVAENGREALECMQQDKPDLITLDLLMPEMDGFAFLEAKGDMAQYAHIPVVVLSAVSDQMEGSPLVADAVMSKPVRRSEMLPLIDSLLPNRSKRDDSSKPKLLLVDDDPKAIKIVASYLLEQDYEVLSAFGGADGIELAKAERPDLIILDLMMPEVSGFDVLTALKQDNNTCNIPVIILTAKLLSDEERQRLQSQVAAIAGKAEAGREVLTGEIERILQRHQRP
ncbi:hypothetical protein BOW50_10840 [Solemya velum gill symbiont]|uniref:response regulator n=1 Tax=Solemya velum gill symbiont TaxID=2340 RepID=UPI00099832CE|nr:response regulator [Solemya velum gill symbiont]OOZ75873.1 hypothetical protein BOW50_10840 [Solemya velum gill symbiont]